MSNLTCVFNDAILFQVLFVWCLALLDAFFKNRDTAHASIVCSCMWNMSVLRKCGAWYWPKILGMLIKHSTTELCSLAPWYFDTTSFYIATLGLELTTRTAWPQTASITWICRSQAQNTIPALLLTFKQY